MINDEVNLMEEKNEQFEQEQPEIQEQKEVYVPRPMWQGWGARLGLVLFLIFVAYKILTIARGGL